MGRLLLLLAAACALRGGDAPPAALAGKVTDPAGRIVQGTPVWLTNSGTGLIIRATADDDGRFILRNLQPGSYDLAAESPGFMPFLKRGVGVRPGQTVVVDVALQLSQIRESLTVTAKAPPDECAFETQPQNSREVLEIREVRESTAKDVGEAVSNLEGIWKIRKGGIANDIVLRGFQQGNLNVLIDGVRINGACPNHMDPSSYHADFAEIETVQVTKGPFDIRNQGSLGGTVNVVGKKPSEGFRVTPGLSTGSFGFWNPSLTASYSTGKLYGAGGYSYRRSETFRDGSGRRATAYANYTPVGSDSNAFDINTGWMKFGGSLPRNQTFDFTYTRQQGGLTLYPYLMMDAAYDNADRAAGKWEIRELTGLVRQVQTQVYFSRVKHWMTDELRTSSAGGPRGYSMATFASTKALGGRAEAELRTTLVGFEGYRRNWNAANTMFMSGMYSDQP